jgi:hypothetical protein
VIRAPVIFGISTALTTMEQYLSPAKLVTEF